MRGMNRIGQLKFGEDLRRWERMREDVDFYPLENVRSYLRIGRYQRVNRFSPERAKWLSLIDIKNMPSALICRRHFSILFPTRWCRRAWESSPSRNFLRIFTLRCFVMNWFPYKDKDFCPMEDKQDLL